MSIESYLQNTGAIFGKVQENKRNQKAADAARRQRFEMIDKIDWEPMYASQTVPQYQKSQSPLARSVIDSFLMGNNPNATMSTAPNAALIKARQQEQQNQMFGTPEQRLAQQNAVTSTNPYTFKTPTRPVMGEQMQEAKYQGQAPEMNGWGFSKDTYDKLTRAGYVPENGDLRTIAPNVKSLSPNELDAYEGAVKNALAAGDDYAVRSLLNPQKTNKKFTLTPRRDDANRAKEIRNLVNKYAIVDDADPSFTLGKRRHARGG